eukprot:1601478-Amphidinium_carterae.1
MAWQNDKGVQDMVNSFKAMQLLGIQLPFAMRGASQQQQQPVQPGSKRWSAQQGAGWKCPKCSYYELGFHTTCFGCKTGQRLAGQPLQTAGVRKNLPSA